MRPGQIEQRTHDYTRHGTLTLFAALDDGDRQGHPGRLLSTSSRTRVSELPARDRAQCSARTRSAPDHGQLRHPQDAGDPKWLGARPWMCMFTSPRPPAPGADLVRRASPTSPKNKSAAASIAPPKSWKRRSRSYIEAIADDLKPFRWTVSARATILAALRDASCLKSFEIAAAPKGNRSKLKIRRRPLDAIFYRRWLAQPEVRTCRAA